MEFNQESYQIKTWKECQYIEFDSFSDTDIKGVFTLRKGGVSKRELSSLNFGLNCGDSRENVEENTRIISNSLNLVGKKIIRTKQVHSDVVSVVSSQCSIKEDEVSDGLITNDEGVALLGVFADCVPVYIFDPIKNICSIVHSGWKGTVQKIVFRALELFIKQFKSDLKDVHVVIGPAIGGCCFELGEEVIEQFRNQYEFANEYITPHKSKYKLDLKALIAHSVFEFGVKYGNITVCDLCTKCRTDIFYSHRGENGKTGRMAGIIFIKGREFCENK